MGGGGFSMLYIFFVKMVSSRWILANGAKCDFGIKLFFGLNKGGGDLAHHFDLQPISAKKGGT